MFPIASAAAATLLSQQPHRGYVTLKDIQLRLKSIQNIGKITKSMKMIASTKLNRASRAMQTGKEFGQHTQNLLKHLAIVDPTKDGGRDWKSGEEPIEGESKDTLLLACSSDRGLCGSIHSSVSKTVKRIVEATSTAAAVGAEAPSVSVVVLGDKAKPQIARMCKRNIVQHFNHVGKNIPTFLDALVIWQTVKNDVLPKSNGGTAAAKAPSPHAESGKTAASETIKIVYNRFISAINFDTSIAKCATLKSFTDSPNLARYEYEPDTLADLVDYLVVCRLYWCLVEGHAAEMSAKMSAMENATKNAEEIVVQLTMKYNRTRQAVITNELVDIITGASAL